MKLPNCIPRLNRVQKTVRNFLLAPVLLLALWAVKDFPAPTAGMGAAWAAAAQGLPKPEVLYQLGTDRDRTHLVLGWNGEARLAYAQSYHNGWFSRNVYMDFKEYVVTPEDGIALLFPRERCWRWGEPLFYLWTDIPGAARAEGSLRLRSDSAYSARYYDPDSGEDIRWNFFGWDESYALEAEINAHGVCAFSVQMKYGKEEGAKKQALLFDAEDHALAEFTRVTYALPYDGLTADIRLTFYDREGNALRAWEKTLCSLGADAETPAFHH